MTRYKMALLIAVLLLAFPSTTSLTNGLSSAASRSSTFGIETDYQSIADSVDMSAIRKHIEYFSSLGSRVTGYPGCDRAAEYIYSYFRSIGLSEVQYHEYNITVPIDYGANLTIMGANKTFKIYPMWPNLAALVTTPPEGISGTLIYSRDCSLASFKGLDVEGSIVLTEFNIQDAWLNAMKLGAKAVIFIEPFETNTHESALKLTTYVPLSFPRFYIKYEDAEDLIQYIGSKVTVKSTMRWEVKTAKNVLGCVKGTKYPDLHFIYSAAYDSFSHVPSLSPGADEAAGIAILLEMARYFKQNPPKYTVYFIAFSGTRLAAQGAKWFIHDKIINYNGTLVLGDYSPTMMTDWGANIVLWVDLGISTGSNTLLLTPCYGLFSHWESVLGEYETATFPRGTADLAAEIQRTLKESVAFEIQYATLFHPPGVRIYYLAGDTPIASNAEAFRNLGGPGVALVTTFDNKRYWWTPLDAVEKVNFENLRLQARFIQCLLYTYTNIEDFRPTWMKEWKPFFAYSGLTGRMKWCDVIGRIVEWVEAEAWYKPVPNAIVFLKDTGMYEGFTFRQTIAQNIWIPYMTDSEGKFFIPGLDIGGRTGTYNFAAFKVDEETGRITYAPDSGRYTIVGMIRADTISPYASHPLDLGAYVVFRCGTIVIFDVENPYTANYPVQKHMSIGIYDARTHATPVSFGVRMVADGRRGTSVATIFAPPDTPLEILLFFSIDLKHPIALLTNSSMEKPLGEGYRVGAGEQIVITNTPLHYAENLYWVNHERLTIAMSRGVTLTSAQLHEESGKLIENAKKALKNKDYLSAYIYATEAWKNEKDVYMDVRVTIEDTINTVPMLGLILIPFAFFGERLFIGASGLKRIISLIAIFAIPFAGLFLAHPGFLLATDALLIVLSLVTLILISPVIIVLVGTIAGGIKELRRKAYGEHFVEISRTSIMLTSFSYGIQYIRKRKMRSGLIMSTLILITLGVVLFASLQPLTIFRAQPVTGPATYEGIMIHLPMWGMQSWWWMPGGYYGAVVPAGLGAKVPEIIKGMYGDNVTIALRTWQYRITEGPENPYRLKYLNATSNAFALLGLTPEEAEITGVDKTLIYGRWFTHEDRLVCILPKAIAESLGIKEPNVKVNMMGFELTVIGVVDEELFMSLVDLDNEHFTPLDYRIPSPWADHMSVKELVILPYSLAMSLGGRIQSAAIKFKNPEMIAEAARRISYRFPDLLVVSSYGGMKLAWWRGSIMTIAGIETQIVPIALAIFVLISSMLGSISERIKEIGVFSVVGVSPTTVSIIFLGEIVTAAIISSVVGYMVSIGMIKVSPMLLGSMSLNYTSSWVMTVIGFILASTLAASIYPFIKASKLVTPSLERKWRIPPPRGDRWEVILPIFIGTDREADSLLAYFYEFLSGHMQPDAPDFRVENLTYSEEKVGETTNRVLSAAMALAPYELGIKQKFSLIEQKGKEERRNVLLIIERTEGSASTWQLQNRILIDQFRKQMLIWASLPSAKKSIYTEQFKKVSGK
ncbi:MAG: M28 family peptidase [Candidatus Bathyarchaeia archaeon]